MKLLLSLYIFTVYMFVFSLSLIQSQHEYQTLQSTAHTLKTVLRLLIIHILMSLCLKSLLPLFKTDETDFHKMY